MMRETTWIEIRLIHEDDLKAFATGRLDAVTREAVEAYLLHPPRAAGRVDDYRRAGERPQRRRHLM